MWGMRRRWWDERGQEEGEGRAGLVNTSKKLRENLVDVFCSE